MKNIGITMRLICYPLEIQHGHNFRVKNQSFQFIVNFFGHLKMCFISIVIFCDNTKVQEINSLKPSSLSWIFFCSSYAVSLKAKKLCMTSMWCDKKFNYLSLTFNPYVDVWDVCWEFIFAIYCCNKISCLNPLKYLTCNFSLQAYQLEGVALM